MAGGLKGVASLVVASLLALPTQAAAECLSDGQARSLQTATMPRILDELVGLCAPHLPADATLLARSGPRHRALLAAAEREEAAGRSAAATFLSGGFFGSPAGSEDLEFAAIFLTAFVGKGADAWDCARIEEAWRLLGPMPPARLAQLFALTLRDAPGVICREETD